uniref:Uncharacterized protein n=1 Tax=Arcella intermedia TaxID=1963864 RepID=A0A6B2L0S5_9EUKA
MNGTIPESIGLLSSITSMSLGWNAIHGDLPLSFKGLSSLSILDLTYTQFSLPSNFTFPINLQRLILSGNTLKTPPLSISTLPLIELDYSSNILDLALFKSISSIKTLQKLTLYFCRWNTSPTTISGFPSLTYLNLYANGLGTIPEINLPSLMYLNLAWNRFDHLTQTTFQNLSRLTYLDLSYNAFSEPLPASFDFLPSLKTLNLQNNFFRPPATENIFLRLTSLVSLDLSSSQIGLWSSVPLNFNSSFLTTLNYEMCGASSFPNVFTPLSSLKNLMLAHNGITGTLPTLFSTFTSLTNLDLGGNFLSGTIPSLQALSAISTLDFSGNILRGNISSFNHSSLISLYLNWNILQGTIPSTFGPFPGLVKLSVPGTRLEGTIPDILGTFTALRYLDLSDNSFNGTFPSISALSYLSYLDISGNLFSATSLDNIGITPSLLSLGLSRNPLGDFPSSLTHLTLTSLSLSGAGLDSIPDTITQLSSLISLELSSNNISSISPLIGKLSKLSSLQMDGNQISGIFPSYLSSLYQVNSLDLSTNYFESISESIVSLTSLSYL